MANTVKTTSDWMSLFVGSSRSSGIQGVSINNFPEQVLVKKKFPVNPAFTGGGGFSVSRYSSYSRDTDNDTAASRYSSRYSSVTSPDSSRYSSVTSPDSSRYSTVTSPTPSHRSYSTRSYTSRYIPSSSSRWTSHTYSDDEDEAPRRYHGRYHDRERSDTEERLREQNFSIYVVIFPLNTRCP